MILEADMGIIMKIPKESVSMSVSVEIIDSDTDKKKSGSVEFTKEDIDEMRKDFLENVEFGDEYDAVYMLTNKGAKLLNSLKR